MLPVRVNRQMLVKILEMSGKSWIRAQVNKFFWGQCTLNLLKNRFKVGLGRESSTSLEEERVHSTERKSLRIPRVKLARRVTLAVALRKVHVSGKNEAATSETTVNSEHQHCHKKFAFCKQTHVSSDFESLIMWTQNLVIHLTHYKVRETMAVFFVGNFWHKLKFCLI